MILPKPSDRDERPMHSLLYCILSVVGFEYCSQVLDPYILK